MRSLRRCSFLALLPFLSYCTDTPTEPDLESPVLQIVSGAGSPSGHFYFLPPIAATPSFSGTFDDDLLSQLQVRVCALSTGATPSCTGADIFSFSSSTSPAILRDVLGENYNVNWSTKKGGLSTSINYRIRVFAGSLLLGFADLDVVTNKKQLASVPAGFVGLIKNGSLLIKFRVESGIVASIVVSPSSATIVPSSTQQFTATVTDLHDANIASPTLLWSSSNTATATVDQSGLASALAAGTTTIKAASQGVEGTAALTVQSVSGDLQATDDGYTATGNIAIAIADGASDVLNNDQGTGTLTVSEVQGSSANVGTATNTNVSGLGSVTGKVTLNADGSFTYDPPPGYTGTDQFTYRITDGSSSSNQATVTITVSDMMWFVCDACGGNNRGTLTDPFTSVAAFTAANTGSAPAPQPNQKLYIRSGTYDGATDNLTLRDGQLAFGQAVAASTVFTPDANSVAAYAALTAGTAPVIAPSSGNGVNLASGNTLRGFDVGSAGGIGIGGTNFGELTVTGVSINTTGAGLSLTTGSASVTGVAFASITSGGGTNNIKLSNLGGTNAFALGSGALSGASGNAFDLDNGTAPVSYSGTIANTTARPVRIENYDGGSIALSGAVTGSSSGVLFNANTGATISFTGGLSLSTGDNAAFTATGGGTVTATQNNPSIVNTLATTTGVALSVENTAIGASGLTFQSISAGTAASGPANGIILSSTGSNGGLTVTGNGGTCNGPAATCTGGTIQNTSGAGIALNAIRSPSFDRMKILNTTRSGVEGRSVVNFTFTNGTISGNGSGAGIACVEESNIDFYDNGSGACTLGENTLSGVVEITGNTLLNALYHGVDINNGTGTISDLNISNNTFTSILNITQSKGTAVRVVANPGSGSNQANVIKASLNNNVITNFPSGAGFLLQAHSPTTAATLGVAGSSTDKISVMGNRMNGGNLGDGNQPDRFISASINGRGQANLDVSNNGTEASPIANIDGPVIELNAGGPAIVTATVSNNLITANNVVGASGIAIACDADFFAGTTDNGALTATVTGNDVSLTDGVGIFLLARNSDCAMNATVTGNTVAAPNTTTAARSGIRLDSGSAVGNTTACFLVSGNTTGGSTNTGTGTTSPGINLRKQATDPNLNKFGIVGLSPSPGSSPGVENYVNGQNPGSTSGTFGVGGTALLSAQSGFTSCALP